MESLQSKSAGFTPPTPPPPTTSYNFPDPPPVMWASIPFHLLPPPREALCEGSRCLASPSFYIVYLHPALTDADAARRGALIKPDADAGVVEAPHVFTLRDVNVACVVKGKKKKEVLLILFGVALSNLLVNCLLPEHNVLHKATSLLL